MRFFKVTGIFIQSLKGIKHTFRAGWFVVFIPVLFVCLFVVGWSPIPLFPSIFSEAQ